MARLPRLHVAGGVYHAMLRGNHREDLFATPEDRFKLEEIVAEALDATGSRLHAYCWMSNHLHLLPQVGDQPLGKLMQRIASRYSRYRHKQLHTTGHLFEQRYRGKLVEVDVYFVTLLRYIHRNPIAARMVKRIDDYPWSSHRAYLGSAHVPWIHTEFGLSLLGSTIHAGREAYKRVIEEEMYASEIQEIEGAHPDDSRVIGTDGFLELLQPYRFKPKSSLTLQQIAEKVCNESGISLDQVRSPRKLPMLAPPRVAIARAALDQRVASLHQVARFLNRSPSSVAGLLKRHGDGANA